MKKFFKIYQVDFDAWDFEITYKNDFKCIRVSIKQNMINFADLLLDFGFEDLTD